ncbi:MAG: Na+/H+ antiporter NhaA, partial [Acidimicrobiia bacterium]|nr:Na+/H+ antiporter NhaA [Acidimicrobiia bacterium]
MDHDTEPLHRTWLHSDQLIPKRFVRPALAFTHTEASGGIVLLVAAVLAVIWANSGWGDSYFEFWDIHVTIEIGGFHFAESLKLIVNDGLMAIFFFVVGLEIKRELTVGELNSARKASLPVLAALGGMMVPALIYLVFVISGGPADAINGWGIPMATDIAFSVGVIALLGTRVPVGAKMFLLALAIVDDIGAILVIAIFYTDDLSFIWLAISSAVIAAMLVARKAGIRSVAFYLPLALVVWFGFLESGVHATIAGVILGLSVPARSYYGDTDFRRRAGWILDRWDRDEAAPSAHARLDQNALELAAIARESVSPLERWERALHPWSSFVIIPLFALANAGVRFVGIDILAAVVNPVALGVSIGLVVGKPIGVTLATFLGLKLKLGQLPRHVTFKHVIGVGLLAGIGFTVSLFIAELAFRSSA